MSRCVNDQDLGCLMGLSIKARFEIALIERRMDAAWGTISFDPYDFALLKYAQQQIVAPDHLAAVVKRAHEARICDCPLTPQ